MSLILKNISCLVTCKGKHGKTKEDMKDAGIINNGYIVIDEDIIKEVGQGDGFSSYTSKEDIIIDCTGKTVTPGLIDCHTHVVYSSSREHELKLKLNNKSYIDILKAGGGILSTVRSTRKASVEELVNDSRTRLDTMLLHGTTTIESKSGYGLDLESEVKILGVNKILSDDHPIDIISTYLGAHAIPEEFKSNRNGYIDKIINEHIPYIAENHLAEFIDCFCEEGVFSKEESKEILEAGIKYGLKAKIHADEIESIGGGELAGEIKATSSEHLVAISDEGIKSLAENDVIAVLLPSTSFYLMLNHYADARKMIENGVKVALSTDCNPGTSPNESLQFTMTLACYGMKLFPEEIINAVTINAACAINREKYIGSIEVGKKADITVFNSSNLDYLIYHIGNNAVDKVIKNGKIVIDKGMLKF